MTDQYSVPLKVDTFISLYVPHAPSKSTSLHHISWPAGTPMTESKQSPHSEVATILFFGTLVVE